MRTWGLVAIVLDEVLDTAVAEETTPPEARGNVGQTETQHRGDAPQKNQCKTGVKI